MESSASLRPPFDLSPLIETISLEDPATGKWKKIPAITLDTRARVARSVLYLETVETNGGSQIAPFHMRVIDVCVRHLLGFDGGEEVNENLHVICEHSCTHLAPYIADEVRRRTNDNPFEVSRHDFLCVYHSGTRADGTERPVRRCVLFTEKLAVPDACAGDPIVVMGHLCVGGVCIRPRDYVFTEGEQLAFVRFMSFMHNWLSSDRANVHVIGTVTFTPEFHRFSLFSGIDFVRIDSMDMMSK